MTNKRDIILFFGTREEFFEWAMDNCGGFWTRTEGCLRTPNFDAYHITSAEQLYGFEAQHIAGNPTPEQLEIAKTRIRP